MTMTEASDTVVPNLRWEAVLDNNETFDGVFVYAVVTTGVYCRPSCPSRKPRAENVRFFPSTGAALDAGFRACLRCRPDQTSVQDNAAASIVDVCRSLEDPHSELSTDALAVACGWTVRQLQRRFKDMVGVSMSAYRRGVQAEAARLGLHAGQSVTDAIFAAGYGSTRAFYEHGAPRLGMPPKDYRAQAPDRHILYEIAACDLGLVVVATTDVGVCAVRLGDDRDELVDELREEFRDAEVREIDRAGEQESVVAAVVALAEGRSPAVTLPLDVRGTAFQELVWEHLQTIPPGTTQTYGEVAAAIGRASSFRAVANACGANPVALVIPCHRVVRSDGSHGGYRWGEARKRELLAAETP